MHYFLLVFCCLSFFSWRCHQKLGLSTTGCLSQESLTYLNLSADIFITSFCVQVHGHMCMLVYGCVCVCVCSHWLVLWSNSFVTFIPIFHCQLQSLLIDPSCDYDLKDFEKVLFCLILVEAILLLEMKYIKLIVVNTSLPPLPGIISQP